MTDDPPPEGMTDKELDALDAEITRDQEALRIFDESVAAKMRRYKAELDRRRQTPGTVHQLRPRQDPE